MAHARIIQENNEITRFLLDSGKIKTSVFLVKDENNAYFLIDCGFDQHNILEQFIPALQSLKIPLESIHSLLLTHTHSDHIGGLSTVRSLLPKLKIYAHPNFSQRTNTLQENQTLGFLRVIALPGHTEDCFAFWDTRTNALICGDALQMWGIEEYGVCAKSPMDYLHSHDKLLSLPLSNIFSSHPYEFLGYRAIGKEECKKYVQESKNNYLELISFVKNHLRENSTPLKICELFEISHPNHPKMQPYAIQKIIDWLSQEIQPKNL